ncbi:hypothetical protein Y032_0295g1648 [Ancylostoma ceylanicum]|uniref:Uncharacterized protein n=1 Tax=Ancylostoma ceylanicum TaxID=53326 RepID=A0A016S4K8_9BILA|nr:hypothetical protein Y032_0295g1648 [Ancylostoma ceylanicum]
MKPNKGQNYMHINVDSSRNDTATVGVDGYGLSTVSKSTQRDRAAQAGILSGTTNYGVFLTVIQFRY